MVVGGGPESAAAVKLGCRRVRRARAKEKPQASEDEKYAGAYGPPSERLSYRAVHSDERPEDHDEDAYHSRVAHDVRP